MPATPEPDVTPQPSALLTGEPELRAFAEQFAETVRHGDVILLDGPVGAGKTAFSRFLIQQVQRLAGQQAEDVPSPTFTLVQTYEAGDLEIWHADLYRLGSPDEVAELGLIDAFETSLCLIEWPDRLGDDRPPDAVTLFLDHHGPDARTARVAGDADLADRLRKALQSVPHSKAK